MQDKLKINSQHLSYRVSTSPEALNLSIKYSHSATDQFRQQKYKLCAYNSKKLHPLFLSKKNNPINQRSTSENALQLKCSVPKNNSNNLLYFTWYNDGHVVSTFST